MKSTLPAALVVISLLAALAPLAAATSPPGGSLCTKMVNKWFDDQVWRPGGPNQREVIEFFGGLVKAGNRECVGEARRQIMFMVDHGALEPEPFLDLVPALNAEGQRDPVRAQLVWLSRPIDERRSLLVRCLEESICPEAEPEIEMWQTEAANEALDIPSVPLLQTVERFLVSYEPRSQGDASFVRMLQAVYLPIARASLEPAPARAYAALVREQLAAQAAGRILDPPSDEALLIERALIRLVWDGGEESKAELRSLWKSAATSGVPTLAGAAQPTASRAESTWTRALLGKANAAFCTDDTCRESFGVARALPAYARPEQKLMSKGLLVTREVTK